MIQLSEKKVLLHIDPNPIYKIGLRSALNGLPQVGEIHSATTERLKEIQLQPDLILLEIATTPPTGVSTVRAVASRFANTPILVVSCSSERIYANRCLKAGARGYVMKTAKTSQIAQAVDTLLSGGLWVSSQVQSLMIDRLASEEKAEKQPSFDILSDREILIIEQIALSKNNKEIAEALKISTKTIESHRSRIRSKLRLATPQELVIYAVHLCGD